MSPLGRSERGDALRYAPAGASEAARDRCAGLS